MSRNFMKMLRARMAAGYSFCVGLDTDPRKLPQGDYFVHWKDENIEDFGGRLAFNCKIIDATHDLVLAYKPNIAFYTKDTAAQDVLYYTIRHIQKVAPNVLIILDTKRGDIGNTNIGYVEEAFGRYDADAVTVHNFLGQKAMQPFLDEKDKGIFVLCRTSNDGADEFQNLDVSGDMVPGNYMPFYQYVAHRVSRFWNTNGNCGLVVGATAPNELAQVRRMVGDMPILIPGIGAQGGDLEATVKAGADSRGQGMIINEARSVLYASPGPDFADAGRNRVLTTTAAIRRILQGEAR